MAHWNPAPRTPAAEKLYAAAEADRANNPGRYRLGIEAADDVVERATAGRDPAELDPSTEWRAALERYLESAAQDGRLNALGARTVQDTAVAKLRARSAIDRYLSANPSVVDRPLDAPIVLVGAWRTGTTFLFRLLAGDPHLRAPLPAELTAPWRIATLGLDAREKLIDASAAAHDMLHLLNPSMPAVHNSGARLAEECVLAMGTGLRNWAFASTTRLDGYVSWLATQSFAEEYRRHRQTLQILDDDDGRRWLLKAPAHTAELHHLAATYPGACIVHLHRDIVETVASGASLFATYRSTYSDEVDAHDVGRFQTEQTELWLRRAVDFRSSTAARSVRVIDVRYTDLVANPEAAVRQIYAAAGFEPPDLPALIVRHNADQARHGPGVHRYRPDEFGIDADALRERMSFYTAFAASIVDD